MGHPQMITVVRKKNKIMSKHLPHFLVVDNNSGEIVSIKHSGLLKNGLVPKQNVLIQKKQQYVYL